MDVSLQANVMCASFEVQIFDELIVEGDRELQRVMLLIITLRMQQLRKYALRLAPEAAH